MVTSVITPAGKSLQVKRARLDLQQVAGITQYELFGVAKDDVIAFFKVTGAAVGDTTSALLDLGVVGALQRFATDIDINVARTAVSDAAGAGTTTGMVGTGLTSAPEAADEIIIGSVDLGTGDAAAGPMYVEMYYYAVNRGEG